ncbi:hypothetical protein HUE56_24735 (plasmid) [Azospirillum oryzae]|uniref:Uncharacterized protein n=1 Tax=Azospirillum oryzae TaxID=286727 RepID=A0A6N1AQU9_9PROT|nr:hypothetical protein [Azospirillum oryzae]KAA0587625.1 hypothetical protein FZ938_15505 [Azospirillum oryzae]QKS53733.1 hypothetical protein HUE56_24735 [Azospirillum oryzae]
MAADFHYILSWYVRRFFYLSRRVCMLKACLGSGFLRSAAGKPRAVINPLALRRKVAEGTPFGMRGHSRAGRGIMNGTGNFAGLALLSTEIDTVRSKHDGWPFPESGH